MNEKNILKEFLYYVFLSVVSMVSHSIYVLVDTFFISHKLGVNGLAALNLALPVFGFIGAISMLMGVGGSINYSIEYTRNGPVNGNKVYTTSMTIGAMASVIFIFIGIFYSRNIAELFNASIKVLDMAEIYIKTLLLFAPAFIFNRILSNFIKNDNNPRLASIALIVSNIFNIIFDYIFMYPLNMGIFGAIFATGLSVVFSMLFLTLHFFMGVSNFKLVLENFKFDFLSHIISSGMPSLLNEIAISLVMILFNIIVLNLEGDVGVAAYGVIANVAIIILAIYVGISQGMQPLLSKEYANFSYGNLKLILKYGMITSLIYSVISYAYIYFKADFIVSIFNSQGDKYMANLATYGMRIYFTGMIFAGFNIIFGMYYASIRKNFASNIITMLRGIVFLSIGVIVLSKLFKMTGVWLSFPVAELLTFIYAIIYYYRNRSFEFER